MVGSVWSGYNPYDDFSVYGAKSKQGEQSSESGGKDEKKSTDASGRAWGAIPADDTGSFSPWLSGGSVRTAQVSSQISQGDDGSSAGGASPAAGLPAGGSGSSGDDDEDETVTIYKTIVLPDGSKLLQIITRKPDGTVSTTTTKMPGIGKSHGDSEKKAVDALAGDDRNTGEQKDDDGKSGKVGAAAVDVIAKSAGLQED